MRREHVQDGYDVRLEWGREGVALLGAHCAVVVIVDVLSFCTAVDVAVERGAAVLPLPWGDERAADVARCAGVVLAGPRGAPGLTLSPASLREIPAGTRLALPSPNGATLCALAQRTGAHVLAGCLRNAAATARTAQQLARGGPIGLVPAGERWELPGEPMRPALEDALGAGAIAGVLPGAFSPEAELAAAGFGAARSRGLHGVLAASASGRELAGNGFTADITLAAAHDASERAPRLRGGVLTA
ncbi:MAG TPA: 2-phosphosulfolactate phosphatase [Pseudonocardiaceae bacterium]|nr:2-phosphosulfolactate phosphatase [Pseudonocardiaceae bacterium]